MDDLSIRQYEPSDIEACRSLWVELTEAHRELYDDPSIGGEQPGLLFDRHLERVGAECIWTAQCGGEAGGFVSLRVNDSASGDPEGEVAELVVSQRYRRRGIGRALLDFAIGEARRLGVGYLSISPVARNAPAMSLYHQAGFQLVGQIELFMDLKDSKRTSWKPAFSLFNLPLRM